MLSSPTFHQTLSASSVFCSSFLYGLAAGWNGPAFNMLTSPNATFQLSLVDVTWITSLPTSFTLLLTIALFVFMNNYSRKMLIIYNIFMYFISWSLCLVATSPEVLLLSKLICDCGSCFHDVIACIYIGEISSVRNRSIFAALQVISFSFGNEVEDLLDIFNNYSLLSIFPLLVSIIGLISLFFMVESPYYLILKGKTQEAITVLSYLNGEKEAQNSYDEIIKYCEEDDMESVTFFQYLVIPQNLKLCATVVILNALVYFSSFQAFLAYGPLIMRPLHIDSSLFVNLFGVQICVFVSISLISVKMLGRRALMLYGFILLTVIQLCIGAFLAIEETNNYSISYIPQIIVGSVSLFLIVYMLTVYPTIHVLRSEIFPTRLKERGTCILVIFKRISDFTLTSLFFPLSSVVGTSCNFFIYAVGSALGAYFTHKFLKETRGKTLAEIKNDYKT